MDQTYQPYAVHELLASDGDDIQIFHQKPMSGVKFTHFQDEVVVDGAEIIFKTALHSTSVDELVNIQDGLLKTVDLQLKSIKELTEKILDLEGKMTMMEMYFTEIHK